MNLLEHKLLHISQWHELAEWLDFETRNRYQILDHRKTPLAYAAEQGRGIGAFVARQFLGHWRTFDVHVYSSNRQPQMVAHHPFRLFFRRLEIFDANRVRLGAIQQRFGLLTKKFDILSAQGTQILRVRAPLFQFWTFRIFRRSKEVALIRKRWSGAVSEIFTDRDDFTVEFTGPDLGLTERQLILAASLFVDLVYFERRGR